MSLDMINSILDQILSIALPEGVARLSEMADQHRKRETLQDSIRKILESAQPNAYYNDLTRLLLDARVLQDCFSSYATGTPPQNVDIRISDALERFHIDGDSAACITGVFQQIWRCMDSVMLKPASAEEARTAYRQRQVQQTAQDTLAVVQDTQAVVHDIAAKMNDMTSALSAQQSTPADQLTVQSILAYCESVPDTADKIPRKLMPFSENGKGTVSVEFIHALLQSHIVIVNDAGSGKTIALRQFFHAAKACGYNCVYLSLNRYPGIPLLKQLVHRQPADGGNIVLFMDGYSCIRLHSSQLTPVAISDSYWVTCCSPIRAIS